MKKNDEKHLETLIICVALPLLVGLLSGFLSRGGMQEFKMLIKPPLSPPAWLFPVAWTILYTLMGIASWLVIESDAGQAQKREALLPYVLQLAVNFFWSLLFFNLQNYLFAFIWLVLLWLLILWTVLKFYRVSRGAAYLLVPYLLWVTFAGYLNLAIYLLN